MLADTPSRPLRFLPLVVLLAFAVTAADAKKPKDPEELFNPLLGVDYSHWLVGPVVEMASEKEVEAYLGLTSDEEARAFITGFWAERNQGTAVFKKTPEDLFRLRVEEADKRFSEGTYPGSRTARGTVLILYGEPEKISFESPQKVGYPPLEVWEYPKDAEKGLDDERPKRRYRFVEVGESTVLFTGQNLRADPRARLRIRN